MSMENLDPLRQKPNFSYMKIGKFVDLEALLSSVFDNRTTSTQAEFNIVSTLDELWTSHVEPLMKELDGILCVNCGKPKSGHYHDVVSSRFACYAGTEKCSILTFEVPTFERARDDRQRFVNEHEKLQSRIRELEEENKLLKARTWTCPICRKDRLMPDRVCDHGNSIYHHGFSISGSLLNQKP